MLTEVDQVAFVVRVNGVIVSPKYPTPHLAEAAIFHLSPEQQLIAEVVPVQRDSGRELLLG